METSKGNGQPRKTDDEMITGSEGGSRNEWLGNNPLGLSVWSGSPEGERVSECFVGGWRSVAVRRAEREADGTGGRGRARCCWGKGRKRPTQSRSLPLHCKQAKNGWNARETRLPGSSGAQWAAIFAVGAVASGWWLERSPIKGAEYCPLVDSCFFLFFFLPAPLPTCIHPYTGRYYTASHRHIDQFSSNAGCLIRSTPVASGAAARAKKRQPLDYVLDHILLFLFRLESASIYTCTLPKVPACLWHQREALLPAILLSAVCVMPRIQPTEETRWKINQSSRSCVAPCLLLPLRNPAKQALQRTANSRCQ
ncbi:hypothetical protein LY78DRAFT_281784 [Colletotrichum sublineola]|nr:hypothetical protein LY78DRAFT_281784 [Colletotrichum sublineola]